MTSTLDEILSKKYDQLQGKAVLPKKKKSKTAIIKELRAKLSARDEDDQRRWDASQHQRCVQCRWWFAPREWEDRSPTQGECRRFPPYSEGWPKTSQRDGCGEFSDMSYRQLPRWNDDV